MKNRLAIIGAGELGIQIAHHANNCGYTFVGFFDDFISKKNNPHIISNTEQVFEIFSKGLFDYLFIGIGYKHLSQRKEKFNTYKNKIPYATIIDSTAIIDPTAKIGEGVIIYPGCIIDKDSIVQNNVLLNLGVVLSHNSVVGEHTFISPCVAIAGFTTIGECCNIGINTTIIDNITITDRVTLGAGSVVIKNICQEGIYVGNPIKMIRRP